RGDPVEWLPQLAGRPGRPVQRDQGSEGLAGRERPGSVIRRTGYRKGPELRLWAFSFFVPRKNAEKLSSQSAKDQGLTITINTPCGSTVAVNCPLNCPRSLCCHR